jgi:hypothetical protein
MANSESVVLLTLAGLNLRLLFRYICLPDLTPEKAHGGEGKPTQGPVE